MTEPRIKQQFVTRPMSADRKWQDNKNGNYELSIISLIFLCTSFLSGQIMRLLRDNNDRDCANHRNTRIYSTLTSDLIPTVPRAEGNLFPNISQLILIDCVSPVCHPKRNALFRLRRTTRSTVWGSFQKIDHNTDALLGCSGIEHWWRYKKIIREHSRRLLYQSIPFD